MEQEHVKDNHEIRIQRLENNEKDIFDKLEEIKDSQHSQQLINQKMNFTLDTIHRERELEKENKKEYSKHIKQIKYMVMSASFTFLATLLMALIQFFFF